MTVLVSEDARPDLISPEGAEVATQYLRNACSIADTANYMNMPVEVVNSILNQPLVKRYVHSVLREHGHQHMSRISERMDEIIEMKLLELEEAGIGSNKDIADLLTMAFKMRESSSKLIQQDSKEAAPVQQTNNNLNVFGEGSYGKLMERLTKGST